MKRKFMLQVVAWLLTVAMLLPSANAALTTAYAAGEKAAYTGSATFTASGEWAEKELTMKDLIGNVNPDDVAYISFTSDAKFNVGYNPADHSAWKWANYSTKHDVSDIALDGWFAFKFALNANDGKSYTIKWSVYTGDAKAPAQEQGQEETDKNANVVFSNSVTFSDASWWTAYEIRDRAFLIGDVKPEDVAYVKFTSDTTFLIGYNNGGGYFQRETDSPVTTWVARDINWDLTEFFLQLMLSKGDGKNYTIKWDVVSKIAATPTPTPTPTATPTPTPVPKYTDVGETLTVTEDMVKNGVVTIKNAQYDEIIVPAGLGITKINFNVIDVEKLVFEGGENYTVNLRNALVEETEFAAPKVKEMTYEELVKELEKAREAEDASAAVTAVANEFVASLQAKSKAAEAQIKLNAYDSELDSVSVKANARIDVTEASVKDLAVSTKEASQRMEVKVTGFNGDAKIDLDKGGRTYNAPLSLTFRESAVNKLDVTGNEIFHVEGSKSTVDTMTLSGVNSVSSNLDAANLVVDEKNENANVRVYSDVANLIVEGEKNDVVLPACASIENAIVAGDNIRVYGLGELGNAEVTGTGANVATIGTAVEGENNTTMPQAMIEMLPTATPVPAKPTATPIPLEGAAYANGGEYVADSEWWAQYPLTKEELLGDVAEEDVDHITFFGEKTIAVGYNPVGDSNWINIDEGTKKVTILGSDIEDFGNLGVILRSNSGAKELVIWRVYTTPMTEDEGNEDEATNSITFSDSTGWSAVEPSVGELLGKIKPADVESIEFSSTTEFAIGYKNKTGTTTVGNDPYFTKVEGKNSYVISAEDIVLEKFDAPDGETKWFYMQIILQKNDGVDYTISWKINLKDSASSGDNEADADYVGDWKEGYKFAADVFADLTGEVTVALQYRTVSTATDYQIKAYEKTTPWKDLVPADYAKTDYSVNSSYNTMSLDKTEGTVSFTLTAETVERIKTNAKGIGIQVYNVIIEDATVTGSKVEDKPTEPEVVITSKDGKGSVTFADKKGWTEQEITMADLLAGVDTAKVESITFASDIAFVVGYNNTDKENDNWWSQPSDKTSYTLSNIALETFTDAEGNGHGYGLKICLSKNDGVKYTINWTVNKKAESSDTPTTTPTVTPGGNIPTVTPGAGGNTGAATDDALGGGTGGADTPTATPTEKPTPTPDPVVTTVFLNTGYQGKWSSLGNRIPKSVFEQYTGDVVVTLTVEHVDTTAEGKFGCVVDDAANDYAWIDVPMKEAEGVLAVPAGENAVSFTLSKESIETILNYSALGFKVDNLIIKSAVLSGQGEANADAAYEGGYQVAHMFHLSEISAYAGKDISVTINYKKTVATVDYYQVALSKGYAGISYKQADANSGTMVLELEAAKLDEIISAGTFLGIVANGLIIENAKIEAVESDSGNGDGEITPSPIQNVTYNLKVLNKRDGWGYTADGGNITYSGQHAEVKYVLPSTLRLGDYNSATVNMNDATDVLAVKLYDAEGTEYKAWYGKTGTTVIEFADLDEEKEISMVAVMSQNGECSVNISSIIFEKTDGTNIVYDTAMKLDGWGYTAVGGFITFSAQHAEVKHVLPNTLRLGDYESVIVNMSDATDELAVKLYDAEGAEYKAWYGKTDTTTLEFADLDEEKEISMIAIMSQNGECTVNLSSVEFIGKSQSSSAQ